MAITAFASPTTLTWSNFTPVSSRIRDPHDGTLVDALTEYQFFMPSRSPRRVDGQFAVADPLVILITPRAQVWTGVRQTAALLSHEQFHYDVGIVIARAAAKHLMALRAASASALASELAKASRLHFVTRNKLIQQRYDKDTQHGTNSRYQGIWKGRMRACVSNPRSDRIGGFYL